MKYLICPLCALALTANAQGVVCANRHQFDRAKEGYFNLLPVQHKNSLEPGDAKQQLQARREFLQAGFFSPLLDSVIKYIPDNTTTLLDIGCGEGYFTAGIHRAFAEADIYGIDIAKTGIRLAAKRVDAGRAHKISYAVASSYNLPIADASMDVITRIYAPSKDDELRRVLKPGGTLIIVTPGENHLVGLRQSLYDELRPHPKPQTPQGFFQREHATLTFQINFPQGAHTRALLHMTPFAWRLKPDLIETLVDCGMADTVDFQITCYQID